ncbi:hypothetical protein L596_004943 [Steinernema carpocapsae]|uniref:Uncharacterized protein n=1 Tax=Steinernema carpocapsae TaxID=34508 RepID=A0A4U8V1K5_STECR|nr:hypothetical protein L596_004943 [Steinernema carpocapsae]
MKLWLTAALLALLLVTYSMAADEEGQNDEEESESESESSSSEYDTNQQENDDEDDVNDDDNETKKTGEGSKESEVLKNMDKDEKKLEMDEAEEEKDESPNGTMDKFVKDEYENGDKFVKAQDDDVIVTSGDVQNITIDDSASLTPTSSSLPLLAMAVCIFIIQIIT